MSLPEPGSRKQAIHDKLSSALAPAVLLVEDESHNHSVPKGAQSHFKVVVVSAAFDGVSLVRRHQIVYGALREELAAGLHALAITAKSPSEWAETTAVPASPPCLGGSKAEGGGR